MPARPESDLSDFADERGDLVPLGRLVLWTGLAALAAFSAVLAARSDIGSQRIAALMRGLPGPARSAAATPPASAAAEPETRRLAATVAALSADRDRLAARLAALERSLEVTGSVPAADPPRAEETHVSRTEFGLELGTAASLDALRSLWAVLKGQHGGALEGLRPLVAVRDDPQTGAPALYLVAGPFLNAAAAARLCAVIAANGRLCQPVPFEGQRLALR